MFRGSVVEHPRYAGQRVFGAGINLTHLYQGRIDFLFYLVRDLGYVSKLYRGLSTGVEKLWIAAVENYAIGGACQLLHVVDHVIAARGSRLYLPARREGSSPEPRTFACPDSSATAPPARPSSRAANGWLVNLTPTSCATRSSSRRPSTPRSRPESRL